MAMRLTEESYNVIATGSLPYPYRILDDVHQMMDARRIEVLFGAMAASMVGLAKFLH